MAIFFQFRNNCCQVLLIFIEGKAVVKPHPKITIHRITAENHVVSFIQEKNASGSMTTEFQSCDDFASEVPTSAGTEKAKFIVWICFDFSNVSSYRSSAPVCPLM